MVGRCNSDSLGLSITLSEIVESVCMAIEKPFEVIISEDMLNRIAKCNDKIKKLIAEHKIEQSEENESWDWRQDYVLLGSDVSALFPSLSAENTAKAVKNQILKSKIEWQNIDGKWLTLYLKLNEDNIDAKELESVKCYLPKRIGTRGKAPGMNSYKIEEKYEWPQSVEYLNGPMKSKMLGLAMERAIIFFFTNFTYTFGGRIYLQKSGGPIGARITMAVARLVMQEWKKAYDIILKNSNIKEILSGLYVDDGRGIQRLLEYGERYVNSESAFRVIESCKVEDIKNNRSRREITREEVLKAMNNVNNDLTFTMELCEDFEDKRLPTLSFSMWLEKDGIHHSYFEKSMRNQTLLLERTSMSRQSLISILSNELTRRLEVLDERLSNNEVIAVINKFTQQLVNSEFSWKQCREIVVSSLLGYTRKEKRRKAAGKPKYRSGCDSLEARVEKKLTEKYNWFRKKRNKEENEENKEGKNTPKKENAQIEKSSRIENDVPKAVLFVQHTPESELAKDIRRVLNELRPWTNISIKVVERAGERVQDILHKSDPWENRDCGRNDCPTCTASSENEKIPFKSCTKRSVVYETWCETCRMEKMNLEKVQECQGNREKGENVKRKFKGEKVEKYIYIGETSRSAKERGVEHFKDLEHVRSKSHMLKHVALHHKDRRPEEITFRMRIRSQHKTAFERQISEAVLIRKFNGPYLMNSKKEYNRCYIPQIEVKKSQNEVKKDPFIDAEENALEIIRKMQNIWKKRSRGGPEKSDKNYPQKAPKRQKMDHICEDNPPKVHFDENEVDKSSKMNSNGENGRILTPVAEIEEKIATKCDILDSNGEGGVESIPNKAPFGA